MSALIAWLEKYAILLLAGAIAVCLVALLDRQFELMHERTSHANDVAAINKERADAAELARTWQRSMFNALEAARRNADGLLEALTARDRTIAEQQTRIALLSVDARGLREQLGAYARGRAGGDSLAACQERAGRLADELAAGADLVAEASGLVREGAGLARSSAVAEERNAIAVNECVAAWPAAPAP